MAYPTAPLDVIGLWIGWLLMLMIYSLPLYKENATYRFAEYLYVGIALAALRRSPPGAAIASTVNVTWSVAPSPSWKLPTQESWI